MSGAKVMAGLIHWNSLLDEFEGLEQDAIEARRTAAARLAANAAATAELARRECPPDLIEWGERHGIPTFAQATWQAGFVAGWHAFMASLAAGRAAHGEERG